MFPGSVAGLPESMATMPQLMREAGYRAHMVGKWHLGHAQWKQGPVGRGERTSQREMSNFTLLLQGVPSG